ncbi:protein ABHD11-like isoform X1 [Uloborus diversus]|uniref:protein ABHD11-like isoform X1 n=1 Tax=Uloborus diversus TaxID=327109 RepID=UPI00240A1FD2|nr:protein ABHD11-like isoform X1 [Uloborus diversus]
MDSYTPVKLAHYVAEPSSEDGASLAPIIFVHGLAASKEMWEDIPQVVANESKRKPDRVEALIVEDMIVVVNLPPEIDTAVRTIICKRYEYVQKIPAELDEKEAFKKLLDFMPEILQTAPEVIRNQSKNKENPYNFLKLKRNKDGRWDFPANYKVIIEFLNNAEELMSEPEGVYDGPTSFIYGTLSFIPIPAYEPQIKKHFPNAELAPIEGASHNITGDCPEELTKAIVNFLLKKNNEIN